MTQSGRICGVMAAAAAAIAIMGAAPGEGSARRVSAARQTTAAQMAANGQLRTAEVEAEQYELIYSGRRLNSRIEVEHYLLYHAALLARQKGATSFDLLYLPGEEGPTSHPAGPRLSSGLNYDHWQPHWTYYVTGQGWQPWHPEWGAAFWTKDIDMARVEKYEAHAIIDLGNEEDLEEDRPAFRVSQVIRDLEPRFR